MEMKGDPGLAPTRPLGEGRGDQDRQTPPLDVPQAPPDPARTQHYVCLLPICGPIFDSGRRRDTRSAGSINPAHASQGAACSLRMPIEWKTTLHAQWDGSRWLYSSFAMLMCVYFPRKFLRPRLLMEMPRTTLPCDGMFMDCLE